MQDVYLTQPYKVIPTFDISEFQINNKEKDHVALQLYKLIPQEALNFVLASTVK